MTAPIEFDGLALSRLVTTIRKRHQDVELELVGDENVEQEILKRQRDALAEWLAEAGPSSPSRLIVYLVLNFLPHSAVLDPLPHPGVARRFEAIINAQVATPPSGLHIPPNLRHDREYLTHLSESVCLFGHAEESQRTQLAQRWIETWGAYAALTSRLSEQGLTTLNQWLLLHAESPANLFVSWCLEAPSSAMHDGVLLHYPTPEKRVQNTNPIADDYVRLIPDQAVDALVQLLKQDKGSAATPSVRAKCMLHFLTLFYSGWGGPFFTSIPIVHSSHSRDMGIGRASVLSVCTTELPSSGLITQLRLVAHEIFNPLVRREDIASLLRHGWKPTAKMEADVMTAEVAESLASGAERLQILWLSEQPMPLRTLQVLEKCNMTVQHRSGRTLRPENAFDGIDAIVVDAADLQLSSEMVRHLRARRSSTENAPQQFRSAVLLGEWLRLSPLLPPALGIVPRTTEGSDLKARSPAFTRWHFQDEHGAVADALRTAHSASSITRAAVIGSMPDLDIVERARGGHDPLLRALHDVRSFGALGQPVVLLGGSGTGKTGLAKHFWRAYLQPQIIDTAHKNHNNFTSAAKATDPDHHAGLCEKIIQDISQGKDEVQIEMSWEHVAKWLPFVPGRMTTSDQLLKAELHGYMKGAFTGADGRHYGLLERANGSVLFLDEIHRLSPVAQRLLIDFIQTSDSMESQWCKPLGWPGGEMPTRLMYGKIETVKKPRAEGIDVRVLIVSAASVHSYDELINSQAHSAREPLDPDFIRRLGSPVKVPSLRDRISVIPELLVKLTEKVWGRYSAGLPELTEDAVEWVQEQVAADVFEHGNVAALKNLLVDVAITQGRIEGDHLVPPTKVDRARLTREFARRGRMDVRGSGVGVQVLRGSETAARKEPEASSSDPDQATAEALVDAWERDQSTLILQKHPVRVLFNVLEILDGRNYSRTDLGNMIRKADKTTPIGQNAIWKVAARCFKELGEYPKGWWPDGWKPAAGKKSNR